MAAASGRSSGWGSSDWPAAADIILTLGLLFDSFWRAVAYCLHPRVVALSVLLLAVTGGLSLVLRRTPTLL